MAQSARRSSGFARFWRIFIFVVILGCMAWSIWDANRDKLAPKGECTIHFIDVGQGDAALIVTDGGSVLIDCGPEDTESKLLEYVKRYTESLDYLILTHPHEDHIGGADRILEGIPTERVLLTDAVSTTPTYTRVLDLLENGTAEVTEAVPGYTFTLGSTTFTVFSPEPDQTFEDMNDGSIVLLVEVAGVKALFTGDAGAAAEEALLARYTADELSADILKIGHHGSSSSTTSALLQTVRPKYAVISVASDNEFGHPHGETLNRLAANGVSVYRTDVSGTVTATIKGGKIEWKTEK